ncbi:MAG TPA: hypothetical protein VGO61_21240 [Steroidobacteraceae bacterium]|jgi:hypothetical protein|nr:hypothetical protein [Steroidobacteraceae bacterium]
MPKPTKPVKPRAKKKRAAGSAPSGRRATPAGGAPPDEALTKILRRASEFNRAAGVLTWGAEALAMVDDFRLPTPERPRLFISYRWGDAELESWLDMLVPSIVVRGYRVVYDRDPRNFGRPLSREAVLTRMDVCNYVIAILDERFTARVRSQGLEDASAATHEWEHALARARQVAAKLGAIWFSGDDLPPPFTAASVMDLRPLHTPNFWTELDRYFPNLTKSAGSFNPPVVAPAAMQIPAVLKRTGSLIADQYRLVTICAWKADGSCDRLGPYLVRQLERIAHQLKASGNYTHLTTEAAGAASSD